jgi:hypothetical protein
MINNHQRFEEKAIQELIIVNKLKVMILILTVFLTQDIYLAIFVNIEWGDKRGLRPCKSQDIVDINYLGFVLFKVYGAVESANLVLLRSVGFRIHYFDGALYRF